MQGESERRLGKGEKSKAAKKYRDAGVERLEKGWQGWKGGDNLALRPEPL